MNERILVPGVLHEAETWSLNAREKRRRNMMEMKCLRRICGVTISEPK